MKSLVVVSSLTGNTRKVAGAVAEALDTEVVDIAKAPAAEDYDFIAVGTWIDKGTADKKAAAYIATIKGKKVAPFITLGAYPDGKHAQDCVTKVCGLFDESNEVMGSFICQGKVSDQVIAFMAKMFPPDHPHGMNPERIKRLKDASTHPDEQDLANAKATFAAIREKLEG